jgi:pSer/pThr/pTyr-binding forkhead associated (FHA) protein
MPLQVRLLERGDSPEQTREIPINQPEFLIGRGADCDLRLRATAISRHHCLLRLSGAKLWVSDLGSSNGTFVNGQRIHSQVGLHSGDQLKLGEFLFVVDCGDSRSADLGVADVDPMSATLRLKDPPAPRQE